MDAARKLWCHSWGTKSNKFLISVAGIALDFLYCTVNSFIEGAMSILHGFSISKLWAPLGQMSYLSHLLPSLSFESRASNRLEWCLLGDQQMVDEMLSTCHRFKNIEETFQMLNNLVNQVRCAERRNTNGSPSLSSTASPDSHSCLPLSFVAIKMGTAFKYLKKTGRKINCKVINGVNYLII